MVLGKLREAKLIFNINKYQFEKKISKIPWVYYWGGRGVTNKSGKNKGNSGMKST